MSATQTSAAPEVRPPHNREYEQLVLGAALLEQRPDFWLEISDQLRREDFFLASHQVIYSALQSLAMRGEDLTLLTITDELTREGRLAEIGGSPTLVGLYENAPRRLRLDTEIRRLKDLAAKRWAMRFAARLMMRAEADDESAETLLEQSERELGEARIGTTEDDLIDSHTAIDRTLAEIVDRWNNPEQAPGVLTGFCDLDAMLHGLRPGRNYLLAARPGEGKTTFALNIAHNASRHRRNEQPVILMVSLEMTVNELNYRALATATRIDSDRIFEGRLTESERRDLFEAAEELRALTVCYLEPKAHLLVSGLRSRIQRLIRRYGRVDLVIIDFLQLLTPERGNVSENERLTEISRGLKLLALTYNFPMLSLAQMNREIEKRGGNKEPQLSDLRGSGSLEQDADVVMFLHNESGFEDAVERQLLIKKHRGGKTGRLPFLWYKNESRFVSAARD